MNFDLNSYSMGLGLTMAGWVAGMIVAVAYRIIKEIGR
jgi:hypothetical protein